MPKFKVLSGLDLLKNFESFGFVHISSKGSHMKLRRINIEGKWGTLTIPNHKELDKETTVAIYRQALRYIDKTVLLGSFYHS